MISSYLGNIWDSESNTTLVTNSDIIDATALKTPAVEIAGLFRESTLKADNDLNGTKKDDRDPSYKSQSGPIVRISLFWTSDVKRDPAGDYVTKANAILADHGLGIDLEQTPSRDDKHTILYTGNIIEGDFRNYRNILEMINQTGPQKDERRRLIILFCHLEGSDFGRTVRSQYVGLPFCFIDSDSISGDNCVLIHELGHASGLPHFLPLNSQNVMSYGMNRHELLKYQLIKIERSFFANGGIPTNWWDTKKGKYTY